MTSERIDPVFASALREHLVATVQRRPRRFRRLSWRLGAAGTACVLAAGGGIAYAAGLFNLPGGAKSTPLGTAVTETHTGTATVDLGPRPADANDVSLTLTCLSPGTFSFPGGGSQVCSASDVPSKASITIPLAPGQDSVTVHTTPQAIWTLRAVYVKRTLTTWGVNAHGETYGVRNTRGFPDLIAVAVTKNGVQGYVKASDTACASGGDVANPTQAAAWDKYSATHRISIPVYEDNGTTVIGTWVVGSASGPGVETVPLATSGLPCATNPPEPPQPIEPPQRSTS